jgi:hypothetical protein
VARGKAWREYQQSVAEFFQSLGLTAEVEATVQGARAAHRIDVFVTFQSFGIDHRWVVECKLWKRSVRKEQVMTLRSIVDDVGADRGFILSESSFQSGAITAARGSNITLTSLADLRENAETDLQAIRWESLYRRVADAHAGVRSLSVHSVHAGGGVARLKPGVDGDEHLRVIATLGTLAEGLQRAKTGRFPAPYGFTDDGMRLKGAEDMTGFLDAADGALGEIDPWLDEQLAKPWTSDRNDA